MSRKGKPYSLGRPRVTLPDIGIDETYQIQGSTATGTKPNPDRRMFRQSMVEHHIGRSLLLKRVLLPHRILGIDSATPFQSDSPTE